MKPVIAFDIDGVLADFTTSWRQLANQLYGVPWWSNGRQQTWDHPDLTREQVNEMWRRVESSRFWATLKPLVTRGDIDEMRRLEEHAHIILVTSRKDLGGAISQTHQWLYAYGIPFAEIFFNAQDKAGFLKKIEARAMIEDAPKHLEELVLEGVPTYVRDWPYNRLPVLEDMPRVSSVGEYIGAVLPVEEAS